MWPIHWCRQFGIFEPDETMRRKLRALEPDAVVSFIDLVNVWTVLCLLGRAFR